MKKQTAKLLRHEAIKLLLKQMDYTMQDFSQDSGVSITTIFNWMRSPESCRMESTIESAFLRKVEATRVIPVKKAKAILRNSELTLNISQNEFFRVMMDRHKITVNCLAKETGIERNQVFFWTQGSKDESPDAKILENYLLKRLDIQSEVVHL